MGDVIANQMADLTVKVAGVVLDQSSPVKSLEFLKNIPEDCPAIVIYSAVRAVHSSDILQWEPDTLWETLKKQGINLSPEARNKLQAAITLQTTLSFYWDNIVFQNTVQALNDIVNNPSVLQEPEVAHMNWAVYEAAMLRQLDPAGNEIPEFDDDVQGFVGVVLRRAGFVTPPEHLFFAQDELQHETDTYEANSLRKEVLDGWEALDKDRLADTEFAENPLGVQLFKLAVCHLYLRDKMLQMNELLLSLVD